MCFNVIQCNQVKEVDMTILKSFRLPKDVVAKLEEVAKEEKRTLANLVIKILSDFTDKK